MSFMLTWLAENSVIVMLMIPLVMLACRLFRRRPAVQHLLWVVVLLKLVMPPVCAWPWPAEALQELLVRSRKAGTGLPADQGSNHQVAMPATPPLATDASTLSNATNSGGAATSLAAQIGDRLPGTRSLAWGLLLIWIAGMVITLKRLSVRIRHYRTLIHQGTPGADHLVKQIRTVAQSMGMAAPSVVQVRGIQTPFVWCLGRPKLVWPHPLSDCPQFESVRSIVVHELAHIRRRDHWIGWLELVAGVIWWWNPLLWLIRRRLHESSELACDAVALAACPDRKTYAELLLTLSTSSQPRLSAPVLGVIDRAPAFFERRLSMILSESVSGAVSFRGVITALALAIIALPGWSLAQDPADESLSQQSTENGQRLAETGSAPQAASNTPSDKEETRRSGMRTITGRVVDDKLRPVRGAKLWWEVAYVNWEWTIISGETDDQGRFSLSAPHVELPRRTSGLDALWVLREDKLLTAVAANSGLLYPRTPGELVVQLEPATDTAFQFVSSRHPPLKGTEVEPDHFRGPLGFHIVPEPIRKLLKVKTDQQGWVRMPNMPRKGFHTIRATSDIDGTQEFQLDSTGAGPAARILHMRPTGRVEGQLQASDPEWIKNVQVYLTTRDGHHQSGPASTGFALLTTDEQGRFSVPAIAVGELSIDLANRRDFPGRGLPRISKKP